MTELGVAMMAKAEFEKVWSEMGMNLSQLSEGDIESFSPIDGSLLGCVASHSPEQVGQVLERSVEAFEQWKLVPAPRRGELLRLFGMVLRENKQQLASLVTLECGKIRQEGLGEVQEMIDICDFAVGLSRQLYGKTIASERPGHHMRENWLPLGPVGIISAFNFPVAVWSWNAALALVCGNSIVWKPSEKTPLTALACQHLLQQVVGQFDDAPEDLAQVVFGGREVGEILADDRRLPLVSATGSCAMGRQLGPRVASRFGRAILELGGNNAIIVAPTADLGLAVESIVFGAVGTAGQRCTTTRRLFVHDDVYDKVITALKLAYSKVRVGNPLLESTLVGPMIDEDAFQNMQQALQSAEQSGGLVTGGERVIPAAGAGGFYVRPAIVEIEGTQANVREETFAPILYIFRYRELDNAIARQNDVPQGLSSAIFTNDLREAELFMSVAGSDCGLANVNLGTSGAEIGGAFGGEKETGGGRESGSDAWKGYMRRQTNTINFSAQLNLAQGIVFNAEE